MRSSMAGNHCSGGSQDSEPDDNNGTTSLMEDYFNLSLHLIAMSAFQGFTLIPGRQSPKHCYDQFLRI